jgi:hypothetical protein
MKRSILTVSLMLSCCGTEIRRESAGHYDSVAPDLAETCEMWDMWQDGDGYYPAKICLNPSDSDKMLLNRLTAHYLIRDTRNYRIERNDNTIWLFERNTARIILEKIGD